MRRKQKARPVKPSEKGDLEALDAQFRALAAQYLGPAPLGRLDWLARFIREDPQGWRPEDCDVKGYMLRALAEPPPSGRTALETGRYHEWQRSILGPLPRATVLALHAEIRDGLRALTSGKLGFFEIPTADVEEALVRASAPGAKPARYVSVRRTTDERTAILQAVRDLILQAGDRLIGCRECGEPIVAWRKRTFCNEVCLQHWHDRQKAERKRTVKGGSTR